MEETQRDRPEEENEGDVEGHGFNPSGPNPAGPNPAVNPSGPNPAEPEGPNPA